MIKAVLLDLDDTLLRIDTDAFVRGYLESLAAFVAGRYNSTPPEVFKQAIRSGARATIRDLNPSRTNAAVMSEAIATGTQIPIAEMNALLTEFYAGQYADLSSAATQVEGAATLIDHLLAAGLMVGIATNPLFPQAAILGRLAWAGINLDKSPLRLITTLDNMHFTKPNPHYYEEILARIGVEADDALMVGDSIENDMIPATKAGLSTFWITWERATPPEITPDGAGTLRHLDQCVADGWLQTLMPRPRTPEQVAPRMLGNLAALSGLIAEMDAASWNVHPDPREWSPLEIVCHLRDSEGAVQRSRLERILHEENPFIAQLPLPPGPGERDLSGEEGEAALRAFAAERAITLEFLASLSEADWQRPARHSIFGPTTLLEMAHFTARHDRLHINQLCELLEQCE